MVRTVVVVEQEARWGIRMEVIVRAEEHFRGSHDDTDATD